MTVVLPPSRVAIAGNAPPSREWYRFFQDSLRVNLDVDALQGNVDDLTVRVTALEDAPASSTPTRIIGYGSIYVSATAIKTVTLDGDAEDPGFTTYYGTDTTGEKGWYAVAATLADSSNVVKSTDAAGVTSFDLTDVTVASTGGTLDKRSFDAKGRLSAEASATTTDLTEGTNLYWTNARGDARIALQKGQPSGLASLDAGGKLDTGQLPALAITETFVVNTQAAMLALSAQEGDVAVRTDLSKSFILTTAPASTLANWQELLTPSSPVTSVFGRVGSVTAASGDYTPAQVGAEPAISAGTTSQYWRGDKTWRDFATDVRAAVLTGLSTATSAVISATDTVLSALGKLQAQVSGNTTAIAAKADASLLENGTYTPTLTAVANVSTSTASILQWLRVGKTVTLSGRLDVTASVGANTLTRLGVSIPVPSDFDVIARAGGAGCVAYSTFQPCLIVGDATNDRVELQFYAQDTTSHAAFFTATYMVLP